MFKLISSAFIALMFAALPAQAGPSKKIFKGKYSGNAMLENVVGDTIFYNPVRFKISKTGKITGTAYCDDKTDANGNQIKELLTVKGSIGKVKTGLGGIELIGKASGTFSDGTKWQAKVHAFKGMPDTKYIDGKTSWGAYEGDLTLTK